jgi:hypothetical protein
MQIQGTRTGSTMVHKMLLLATAVLALCALPGGEAAGKPNIMFILADGAV